MLKHSQSLELKVTDLIHRLGIPAHVNGHAYIREAIMLCLCDPSIVRRMTKELYPTLAKQFGVSASSIERSMRYALELAWTRGDIEEIEKYFGCCVNPTTGKPKNKEFLCLIVDRIRIVMSANAMGA